MSSTVPQIEIHYPRTDRPSAIYCYLERGSVFADVSNGLSFDVMVEQLLCSFEEEDSPTTVYRSQFSPFLLRSGQTSTVSAPFDVKLSFRSDTNCFKVGLKYRDVRSHAAEQTREIWYEPDTRPWLIIQRIPKRQETIFISHKISENTELAKHVGNVLEKVGFDSYVAEASSEPIYEDFWEEKLFPEIDRDLAVIVIWTTEVMERKQGVAKEIKHAREVRKNIYLFKEADTDATEFFLKKKKEYVEFNRPSPTPKINELVECVYKDWQTGRLRKSNS